MVTVTGATSQIGNVLVRKLAQKGEDIQILTRKTSDLSVLRDLKFKNVIGDVLNLNSLVKAFKNSQIVYHLAGVVKITPGHEELINNVNVNGTKNVIDACKRANVKRLLYVSTVHALKEPPKGITLDESASFDPENSRGAYDRSKALASLEVEKACREGLDAVIVCPTGAIGPYDIKPSYFGQGILSYLRGHQYFRINGAYNYSDSRDIANGIIQAAKKGKSCEKYLLSGKVLSMKMYYNYLQELTGIRSPKVQIPIPLAIFFANIVSRINEKSYLSPYSIKILQSNSNMSYTKAQKEFGYKVRSIKESLKDQIAWFKENNYV
jgi:dihydroflavonol-4-reductase